MKNLVSNNLLVSGYAEWRCTMFQKYLKINFLLLPLIGIISLYFFESPFSLARKPPDQIKSTNQLIKGALTNPEGIAVDSTGNIWESAYASNGVLKFDPNGNLLSPPEGFTGGGINKPIGITVDSIGNIWVANYGNSSVTKLDTHGNPLSPLGGFTEGGLNRPIGIATDSVGNVWVANYGNDTVTELDTHGTPISPPEGFMVEGLRLPYSISIDSGGTVWVASEGNWITEMSGVALFPSGDKVLPFPQLETLLLNIGGKQMQTLNVLGAEMLPNELTLLKIIIGVGFIGWMFLFLVQTVFLTNIPGEESGLDEFGCHFDKETGIYHCLTGPFAGKDFKNKEEMLKLAA
jgi:hypothetical protein